MKKGLLIGLLAAILVVCSGGLAFAADTQSVTVSGDGVTKTVSYTYAQLDAMNNHVKQVYSVQNNWPSPKFVAAEGVPLSALLTEAGVKSTATMIKVTSSDGYFKTFTYDELVKQKRYYFPQIMSNSTSGQTAVPTIIALRTDEGSDFSDLEDGQLLLMMGQRTPSEQTNPWFVKDVQTIEVQTAPVEKWAAPTASLAAGAVTSGAAVSFNHSNFDQVKLYYTTDGTTPTVNSAMFNISTTYYQPQLNVPLAIAKDTTFKVIAIGPGKADSEVVTFAYTVGGAATADPADTLAASGFTDLAGYGWAQTAINDLSAKKIIEGIGNNKFAPEMLLTRAQFAKIIVLAVGEQPAAAAAGKFTDVKGTEWFAGYVAKAAELGLIEGVGDGTFKPYDKLSKEQMMAIVVRAMGKADAAAALTGSGLSGYTDLAQISSWAIGCVEWAETNGLIEHGHVATAVGDKWSFNGKADANRAEAAQTVYLMLKK